jgi:prevent-host-death family protein
MVVDYGKDSSRRVGSALEETAISKFKATCLATLQRVRKTRRPIRVTKCGEPVADVLPAAPKPSQKSGLGSMAGTVRIKGDITGPVIASAGIPTLANR